MIGYVILVKQETESGFGYTTGSDIITDPIQAGYIMSGYADPPGSATLIMAEVTEVIT